MSKESNSAIDAADDPDTTQRWTLESLPHFTLDEVAERTGITLAELLRYIEVGMLTVHRRETCIEAEKPGVGMAQMIVGGDAWTCIAKMQGLCRRDVPGMEGLADETAVKVIGHRYIRCTLQDVPGMHAYPQDGYLVSADSVAAFHELLAPKMPDKPLDARERTTLLCIIGALAEHAKLDLSQPMKTGDAIAAMMPDVGLSGRTIGEHLKAVREAMESRKR